MNQRNINGLTKEALT